MKLATLTLEEYIERSIEVRRLLSDEAESARLLHEACKDTPIVKEILGIVTSFPPPQTEEGEAFKTARERAIRDLVCFLALRSVDPEQDNHGSGVPGYPAAVWNQRAANN